MNQENKFKHDITSLGKTNMLNFHRSHSILKKKTANMINFKNTEIIK